jgi:intracellular multiplication protein IcmN
LRQLWLSVWSSLIILALAGCHSNRQQTFTDVAKVPTQVAGASDRDILKMRDKIVNQGVRIITIGQDYLISIPSTLLFADQSPKINWGAYGLLNDIACYLQQFRKISIYVNAYSNKYVSECREHALTLARARVVSEYLWSQGIESRFIFTQGLGSDKPIVAFTQHGDAALNSRIEITFRHAVA